MCVLFFTLLWAYNKNDDDDNDAAALDSVLEYQLMYVTMCFWTYNFTAR